MESRYDKNTKLAVLCVLLLLFAAWPPKDSKSQDKSIDVKSEDYGFTTAIQKVDSLNHVLKVEIDLREYQNHTDTVINSQINRKQ